MKALSRDGKLVEQGRVSKVLAFRGLERQPVEVQAGDIVAIAGLETGDRRRHDLRSGGERADRRPADRSADPVHDLPHQ
jgi:translation elongation factor EF-G